jgi:hypothetical protein
MTDDRFAHVIIYRKSLVGYFHRIVRVYQIGDYFVALKTGEEFYLKSGYIAGARDHSSWGCVSPKVLEEILSTPAQVLSVGFLDKVPDLDNILTMTPLTREGLARMLLSNGVYANRLLSFPVARW